MQLASQNSEKIEKYFEFSWSFKELFFISAVLYTIVITSLLFGLTGCSEQPKVIVKKEYIQKPTPVLQTIPINELNLSKDKKLQLHIQVKEK
jgi:hypothetical protein